MSVAERRPAGQETPWQTPEQAARLRARTAVNRAAQTLHSSELRGYSRTQQAIQEATASIDGQKCGTFPVPHSVSRALLHLGNWLRVQRAALQISGDALVDRQPGLDRRTAEELAAEGWRRCQLADSLLRKWEAE